MTIFACIDGLIEKPFILCLVCKKLVLRLKQRTNCEMLSNLIQLTVEFFYSGPDDKVLLGARLNDEGLFEWWNEILVDDTYVVKTSLFLG